MPRLPWWGILCLIICVLPIVWLFYQIRKPELLLPAMNGAAVLGFAIAVKRNLRWRVWFWVTMTIIAGLHLLLILTVPWTTNWIPASAIAGIDSIDLVLIFAIVAVVQKLTDRRNAVEAISVAGDAPRIRSPHRSRR